MKDVLELKECIENTNLFTETLKRIVTYYDTCIVCKFSENNFTKIRQINSKLAIQYL